MSIPRLDRLYAALQSTGLDALALNPGPSLTYLTGLHFHLMERPVVILYAPGRTPVLVLPELEAGKIEQVPYPVQPITYGENPASWELSFQQAIEILGLSSARIGVEPTRLRYLELMFLQGSAANAHFLPATEIIAALRIQKDASEIAMMHQAVNIAQDALNATLPLIKIGMTEQQLAAELTMQLLRHGSDSEFPFTPIVASGPNSANPHAVPGNRSLVPGDLVVIDWGASVNDYVSDLTRSFAIAEVDQELAEIARIVAQANAAGRAAGKPGLPAGEVDAAARKVISDAGYGEYFIHRTGHGLGMEGHEQPYIFGENSAELAAGMVYTIEPGIYLPGRGGVRIEDDVVVTPTGSESLSNMVRDLIVVG